MKHQTPYPSPPRLEPENLDEWLLSLDEFADGGDFDDDEVRCAYDDPARRPID